MFKFCKDWFWLEPKIEIDSGPKSPNNKFVESGRKSKSESREKILEDSIKRKELHMHKYKKYSRSCPSSMIESTEFFLFTVVFFQHFALFFFLFCSFFFFLSFLLIHFRVIYYGFYTNFSTHVWVRCSEFLCPLSPLLEPSTLSCKAANSLLRHHLHINAARELTGQHLMQR